MEKLVKKAIMQHLKSNNLLSSSQHGFLEKKACITNLLETMDFLTGNMAKKLPVDVIFLDFAKAFDKVPHQRMLYKLKMYGIEGNLLDWIKGFLLNRFQRVILGDTQSNWLPVTSGVPQGSVLGPILFVIFINDLPDVICKENICKIYADDTKILSIVNSLAAQLQL